MKVMKWQHKYTIDEGRAELWGHPRGRSVRSKIEAALDEVPPGQFLVVDLKNVEVMDFSFSGEVFGKLIGSISTSYPGRGLALANLTEYVKANLSAALDDLDLLAVTVAQAGNWDVIGKVAETDRETLRALAARSEATAPDLADTLGIKLTTCNQRLRKLLANGAIVRDRMSGNSGGEQLIYHWLA